MKLRLLICMFSAAFAVNAHAGLGDPIRPVDASVNNQFYNVPNVNMPMVPMNIWGGGRASESDKILPDKTVSEKMVPTTEADVSGEPSSPTLQKARSTMPVLQQTNFTGRRADADSQYYHTKIINHQPAPINHREIKANTPAGTEELKKQLNGLQWTTAKPE
jgi:hypothetical protein